MVVDDLCVVGVASFPAEADPVLIIDPNAVLSLAIFGESLETVAGRNVQVDQLRCCIEDSELLPCCFMDIR